MFTSPQVHMLNPLSQGQWYLEAGSLGGNGVYMKLRGWSPHDGTAAASMIPAHHVKTQQLDANQEEGVHQKPDCWYPDLRPPVSRTVTNKGWLPKLPRLWYSVRTA